MMITSLLTQDPPQAYQHWALPEQASTFAADHDALYLFVEWINYIFFFGIMFVLFYSVVKYRRKTEAQEPASKVTHNTPLEVTWTVIPLIIVMIIFALGWKGYADMTVAPANSIQYEIQAKRWEWKIKHPGAKTFMSKQMWVPVDTPCQLTMSSSDVLHSFFIPAFRVKRDVLPGRYQTVWFQPTMVTWKEGVAKEDQKGFHLFCTEFCGQSHAQMVGTVHVVSRKQWDEWMKPGADVPWNPYVDTEMFDPWTQEWKDALIKNGAFVYDSCAQCHSKDGAASTGPSFKGLWARNLKRLNLEGKDEKEQVAGMLAYIKESVRDPNAVIAEGFTSPSKMTPFTESALSDDRVHDITWFIKSLK